MQLSDINRWVANKLFSSSDKIKIWRKIEKLISNDVPIIKAIKTIYDRKVRASGEGDFASIAMKEWLEKMENGETFSNAVADWVPHMEYMLLVAGERNGDLESALRSSNELTAMTSKIRSTVIGGALYPLILISVALAVAYLFGVKLFPQFFSIASEDKWTGMAVYAIAFSHFIEHYIFIVIGAVIAIISAIIYSFPRWNGPVRVKMDGFMPYSLYRTVIGGTWLAALATMINAGERIEDAMVKMSEKASPWLAYRIDACVAEMRQGHNMGDALDRTGLGFPDPEIIDDLGVYSAVSGFDEALSILGKETSDGAIEEVESKSKVMFIFGLIVVISLLAFLIGGLLSMELQLKDVIGK